MFKPFPFSTSRTSCWYQWKLHRHNHLKCWKTLLPPHYILNSSVKKLQYWHLVACTIQIFTKFKNLLAAIIEWIWFLLLWRLTVYVVGIQYNTDAHQYSRPFHLPPGWLRLTPERNTTLRCLLIWIELNKSCFSSFESFISIWCTDNSFSSAPLLGLAT